MNDIPDADFPVGFAQLDKMCLGKLRKGALIFPVQGPVWDHPNKTIDCTYPPRGPIETEQVLRAYREGWRIICGL